MDKAKLERRMNDLEKQVATLRKQVEELSGAEPWWERIAGTFHDDPIYEQAMRLGREYRRGDKQNGKRRLGR
jgi:hypothetical protein